MKMMTGTHYGKWEANTKRDVYRKLAIENFVTRQAIKPNRIRGWHHLFWWKLILFLRKFLFLFLFLDFVFGFCFWYCFDEEWITNWFGTKNTQIMSVVAKNFGPIRHAKGRFHGYTCLLFSLVEFVWCNDRVYVLDQNSMQLWPDRDEAPSPQYEARARSHIVGEHQSLHCHNGGSQVLASISIVPIQCLVQWRYQNVQFLWNPNCNIGLARYLCLIF